MNSTTWIIEPNVLAWGLLIVATGALCCIALFIHRLSRGNTPLATQVLNSPQSAWHNVERVVTWLSFALALIGIGYLTTIGKQEAKVADFSTLATVMGVLVTLLVGWNIYQVIETKDSLNDVIRLRSDFNNIRRELDVLHEMHEAYVLSIVAEDHRRHGRSAMAFEDFMGSASIFLRDLEHYDVRFMTAQIGRAHV